MADTDKVVQIDIGITPEAAVSGAVVVQTEETAFLMFNAMRNTSRPFPRGGYYKEDAGIAVIELVRCAITKFGYPSEVQAMRARGGEEYEQLSQSLLPLLGNTGST